MGLVYDDKGLFLAGANAGDDGTDLSVELFLGVLVHLIHLVEELVVQGLDLLLVKLIDLVRLDLHLLKGKELLTLFASFVKFTVDVHTVGSHLLAQDAVKVSELGHQLVLLVLVNLAFDLFLKLGFLLFKGARLVTLIDFFFDLGLGSVKLLVLLHRELGLVDLDIILLHLSELVLKSIELVVDGVGDLLLLVVDFVVEECGGRALLSVDLGLVRLHVNLQLVDIILKFINFLVHVLDSHLKVLLLTSLEHLHELRLGALLLLSEGSFD